MTSASAAQEIDEHLAAFPPPQQWALAKTRSTILAALPGIEQTLAYSMPTFKADGIPVVGFEGFTRHNSLFPYSGSLVELVAAEVPDFRTSKGTIQFPMDSPFPATLLKRLLRLRIAEINDSFPRRSGDNRQFYDNGRLKYSGKVKDGEFHGAWSWYRRDGSLMRTGRFRAGHRVGEWTTYDRDGRPVRTTSY